MRSVSIRLVDLQRAVIPIGFVGENNHTQVNIDCKKVFDEYPTAVAGLTVQPPQGEAYPAVTVRDGDIVIWTVTDSDLIRQGIGEIQLAFTVDEVVVKSVIARIRVERSIIPTGEIPEPVDNWLTQANAALAEIPQTISESVDAALEEAKESGEFDGPQGPAGEDGQPGAPGVDGFSPVVSVSNITGGHRVSVTDAGGTDTFDVMDGAAGEDGQPGQPGQDGYSPTVFVQDITGGHRVTITDENGDHTFDVMDGAAGDPTELIDDTAGEGTTNKTWSADKLTSALNDKYEKPSGGIPASDLASGVIPSVPVQDVQIDGTSVLSQGVASIPIGGNSLGVVKVDSYYGLNSNVAGRIYIAQSKDTDVKAGTQQFKPITPYNQHQSVFYGMATAAGDSTQSSSSNAVGVYTADALVKIQKMLGIYEAPWELIREDTVTNATEADIEITVDGNGQAFELTDVRFVFSSPKQDTQFQKGDYGRIKFVYGQTNTEVDSVYIGAYTQAANANQRVGFGELIQENGLLRKAYTPNGQVSGNANIQTYIAYDTHGMFVDLANKRYYNKVIITSVTGTAKYKLYGKRKWT